MRITRKMKKVASASAAALLVGVFCFVGGIFWGNTTQEAVEAISSDLISERLLDISELATVEYRYTDMGRFEQSVDFYGWEVPLTQKYFILSYDGAIKAGVDMKQIKVEVKKKTITIQCPAAAILSHELDEDSIQVFNESKNIFNPISITDYTNFSLDQKQKTEKKAIENGLLTEASQRAQESITKLLFLSQEIEKNYKIVFEQIGSIDQ